MKNSKGAKTASGERRRKAIMEAAWDLFMEKGYAAVSMDEIIRKSGGSKSSIYDFFGSKEGLLRELITSITQNIHNAYKPPVTAGRSAREALSRIGQEICNVVLNPKGIGLYMLAVSVSRTAPGLSRLFYDSGPVNTLRGLADFIEKENKAGRLDAKDPMRAAEFFAGMLLVRHHIAIPVGGAGYPSKKEINELVSEAVDMFLAAYGKR